MRIGIRGKFIGIGALIGVMSFVFFSLALLTSQWGETETSIMRESRVFAVANARGIYDDYRAYQTDSDADKFSAEIARKLSTTSYVAGVALIGINGRILFDSVELLGVEASDDDSFLNDSEVMETIKSGVVQERFVESNGERWAEIYAPVTDDDGQHVTSVRYVISFAARNERLFSVLRVTLMSFFPFMLFVVFLMALFAQRIVVPIRKLDSAVSVLGSGKFNHRVRIESQDEIGELTESFNKMAAEVILARQALEDSNRELMGITHQLNTELQKQNEEFTGANAELERMNKFMVGRELRMMELKNEIEELKEKLSDK